MKFRLNLITLLLLAATSLAHAQSRTPVDQQPMYGGGDRSAVLELEKEDQILIRETTKLYGTARKASEALVGSGFVFYQKDDLANAMIRFNKAWTVDPTNPAVFVGFAAVLNDKNKFCDALDMMERALKLDPPTNAGLYADAARTAASCALTDSKLTAEAKNTLLARSDALYKQAETVEANKGYVYGSWAMASYWRGKFAEAWALVAKERAAGDKPDEKFLAQLRGKMSEPAN